MPHSSVRAPYAALRALQALPAQYEPARRAGGEAGGVRLATAPLGYLLVIDAGFPLGVLHGRAGSGWWAGGDTNQLAALEDWL